MAKDGDTLPYYSSDVFSLFRSSLQFDRFRTSLDQGMGVLDRLGFIIVRVDGKIGHEKGFAATTGCGGHMMDHVLHGYMGGIGKSKHHHAKRVSDKNEVRASFVKKASGGVVPGSERSNWWPFLLSCPDRGTLVADIHIHVITALRVDASPGGQKDIRILVFFVSAIGLSPQNSRNR